MLTDTDTRVTKKCNVQYLYGGIYLVFVEVEVVVLLRSPGIQGLSLKTFNLLPLTNRELVLINHKHSSN